MDRSPQEHEGQERPVDDDVPGALTSDRPRRFKRPTPAQLKEAHRARAAAKQARVQAPGYVYDRFLQLKRRLVALGALGVVALIVVGSVLIWQLRSVKAEFADFRSSTGAGSWAAAPSGFAEGCVTQWLAAVGGDDDEDPLSTVCGVDVSDRLLESRTPGALRVVDARALGAPFTRRLESSDPRHALYLVQVQVDLEGFERSQVPDDEGEHGSLGTRNYYVKVSVDLVDEVGAVSMVGLPYEVPVTVDSNPPRPAVDFSPADRNDVRTRQISEFLRAYMLQPPADEQAQGEIGQYLVPGYSLRPLHSPEIADVAVIQTSYGEEVGGRSVAVVLAEVTYRGGGKAIQMPAFELEREEQAVRIARLIEGAPIGAPVQ